MTIGASGMYIVSVILPSVEKDFGITRGMAKSHHAHPLGGGSGRSKGNRPPVGPTGVEAKGGRTRNKKQHSSKLIIRRRVSKRYGQVK